MDIKQLLQVMQRLRDPDEGCPWDKQQTFASLVPHTLEEAYEVADCIERHDDTDLCDELGDLLFQVVFYAQIASEKKLFEFNDVVAAIVDKLIRRHPHVFADDKIDSVARQTEAWEEHKRQERTKKSSSTEVMSELDGVLKSMPALVRAQKLQRRAARSGFDWDELEDVYAKLSEEEAEVRVAVATADQDKVEDEIGDLLFAGVNLARFLDVDAEQALRRATNKFERRFRTVEQRVAQQSQDMKSMSVSELDEIWNAVKRLEAGDTDD
jgi:ATP diphosphatase